MAHLEIYFKVENFAPMGAATLKFLLKIISLVAARREKKFYPKNKEIFTECCNMKHKK